MSIERAHSAGAHAPRAAHAANSKAATQTGNADAAGGGFQALLSALDCVASDPAGEQDLEHNQDALLTGVAAVASADPALAGAAVPDPLLVAPRADASNPDAAAAGVLAGVLLASQSGGGGGGGDAQGGARVAVEGVRADLQKIGASASSAAWGKAAGALPDASGGAQSPAAASGALAARAAEYASVFEQLHNRLAAKSAANETPARPDVDAAGAAGTAAVARPPPMPTAGESRVDRSERSNALMATMALARQGTSFTEALTGNSEAASPRGHEPVGASSVNAPEAGWLHRDFTPTVQYDAAVGVVDASQPAAASQLADQVSYWITQGIRNAELTIGGAGGEPVQVTISLSGNEAHVDFRTEHASTREMLNDSVGHLKDLLQSQGMSLSGVSVGSSGANASGRQQQRPGPGAGERPAAVGRVATGAADVPSVRRALGAVDLFV